jgi:HEPN domain-containing protein
MNQRRALETSAAPLWIDEARDHLKIAGKHEPGLNLRLLCSEAHLGAEKAIKGVMIARGQVFPYTHDIGLLLDQAARIGEAISDEVRKGEALTLYSGGGRYPNTADERAPTTREEYDEAMKAAAAVVCWAGRRVEALVSEAEGAEAGAPQSPASSKMDGGTDPS